MKPGSRSPQNERTSRIDAPKIHNHATVETHKAIVFSFQYLDLNNPKFTFRDCDSSYFDKLFTRKKDVSGMRLKEFLQYTPSLRNHAIDFRQDNVSEDAFPRHVPADIGTPYQFSISTNKHGRVHGLLIGNIFYVVWLDPEHQLYPEQ